jgi:hypothetical protein
MMQVYLALRRSGYTLVYGIPIWYRILASVLALVLLASAIFSGGSGILGTILLGIALFAALYEERWIFDGSAGQCTCRVGLVFAAKGPSFAFSDVAGLRIDLFIKGRLDQAARAPEEKLPPGSQVRLIIDTKAGESYMIESVPVRRRQPITASAAEIAATLGIPLEV